MKDEKVDVEESFHPDEAHGFDYRASEYGAIATRIRRWSRDRRPSVSWRFIPGRPVRARNVIAVSLSAPSDSLPFLEADFSDDTLRVSSRGVDRVTLYLDGERFPRGFRVRNREGRESDAVHVDREQAPDVYFELMQSTCFPRVGRESAWSFTTR